MYDIVEILHVTWQEEFLFVLINFHVISMYKLLPEKPRVVLLTWSLCNLKFNLFNDDKFFWWTIFIYVLCSQVVQVYASWTNSRKSVGFRLPNLQLVAFSRVMVQANSSIQVKLTFKTSVLQVWKDNVGFKLLSGKLLILFLASIGWQIHFVFVGCWHVVESSRCSSYLIFWKLAI